MKKVHVLVTALFAIFILSNSFQLAGQRLNLPENLVGEDLKAVQQEYLKGINKGLDSLLVPYAEALYHDGQTRKALEMYRRADSLQLPMHVRNQRNFSHAAKRLGMQSPYDRNTGYFSIYPMFDVEVRKFGSNSPEEDFAPYVWKNILFVTSSRRVTDRRAQDRYLFTQLPFLKVYAFNIESGAAADMSFLPASLNSSLHDGPLTVSGDTSLVVVTKNYKKPNERILQNLYLEYYVKENGEWSEARHFPYNDVDHSVQHPYFDDKTQTLYFSSDMPGGYGDFDLYTSSWDGEHWTKPENLGNQINTKYDEVFPSLSPDGHLLYTSNHLETTGGLDLVIFKEGKRYLFPEPFNTVYDDLTISFLNDTSGYFASNRNQSPFNDDIYIFNNKPAPFYVRVVDKNTKMPISGVSVSFRADDPRLDGRIVTSAEGEGLIYTGFERPFPVEFVASKTGYITSEIKSDQFVREDKRWVFILELEPDVRETTIADIIPEGYFVVYFDNDYPNPGTWRTRTDYSYLETLEAYKERWPEYYEVAVSPKAELDAFFEEVETGMNQLAALTQFLHEEFKKGIQYTIHFTSHASPLSTNAYNMNLSQRRFVAVENYLRNWQGKSLEIFIQQNFLDYDNQPYGSSLAGSDVPDQHENPASIYGVEAMRERRVTISWRRSDVE